MLCSVYIIVTGDKVPSLFRSKQMRFAELVCLYRVSASSAGYSAMDPTTTQYLLPLPEP
jgi:hypothetical protein